MEALSQKKYLLQVKNAMFFHFCQNEVRLTLEDVKQLFESGKDDGKMDEEINKEMGLPKEFVRELGHDGHRDVFKPKMTGYMIAGLLLCILAGSVMDSLNPVLCLVPAVLFPVYIWNLCGGSCLYVISDGGTHQKMKYGLFTLVSMVCSIMQQAFAAYINHMLTYGREVTPALIQTTRMFEMGTRIFLLVSLLVLAVTVYEVFCGNYLAFATLIAAAGTICASVYFGEYLHRMDAPVDTYRSLCILPYATGVVFSAVFLVYARKKGR